MAVLLSPVGGAAAQFLDNNGNPLLAGKLYTYVAGTTTNQATYTSSSGVTPHTNPIILDAGGRVPGGEIWLTDGLQYKFVLKNANDVLIGTYDNLVGINSNFVNFLTETEVQTATAGQTVFTLTTMQYQPSTNNLSVFVDGVNQIDGATYSYVETSSTVVTFTAGLHVGALVKFTTAQTLSTGVTDASLVAFTGFNAQVGVVQDLSGNDGSDWIGFEPAGTGAVARSAQEKMRDTVSIKDFGAIADYNENVPGSGTDNSAAIQAAIDAVNAQTTNGAVYIPAGAYKILSAINVPYGVSIFGDGGTASILHAEDCDGLSFTTFGYQIGSMFYEDFGLTAATGTNRTAITALTNASTQDGLYFHRLRFYNWNQCVALSSNWNCTISECVGQNINQAVTLSEGNGQTVGIRIINNRFTKASGGLGAADQYGINILGTTQYTESVHIVQNQIFGFTRNINVVQATFVNILGNDLSGSEKVISFGTANGGYSICNNYIEVTGTGTGIYAGSQSVETPTTRTNIEQNYFIGTSGASAVGLQLNDSTNTYQWNAIIRDNTFTGFTTADIRLYASGKTLVDNNRCMSTALTNSIFVGQVLGSPVILTNNYFYKALYSDVPADITDGKLILQNNVENNSFQSAHQAAAPTTGTWRIGDIVYNNAPASAGYVGWVCTVAGTPGTWKTFGLIS